MLVQEASSVPVQTVAVTMLIMHFCDVFYLFLHCSNVERFNIVTLFFSHTYNKSPSVTLEKLFYMLQIFFWILLMGLFNILN